MIESRNITYNNLQQMDPTKKTEIVYKKPQNERQFELEYEEYLKNGSREMTNKWENTIEKIRQRKVAALKKKEEQRKAEGLSRFLQKIQ